MTDRADLLELIDRAPGPLRTLRCRWQSWAHAERAEAAQERAFGQPRLRLSVGNPELAPTIIEGTRDVSYELPDRWRVVSDGPPLHFNTLDISDGHMQWTGSDEQLMRFDRSNTMMVSSVPLEEELYPGSMLGWLRFGDPTPGVHEGRRVWIVVGHERGRGDQGVRPVAAQLLPGADHAYTIDAETGIVLAHEATIEGELCVRSGLSDLVVDEPLDADLFRPPELAAVKSETEQYLAMLEAQGVDTSGLDRSDPAAVREAIHEMMRSLRPDPSQFSFGAGPTEPPTSGPPPPDEDAPPTA
jgi:hypothetical protein